MLGTVAKTKMTRQAKFHCPDCAVKRHCKCYQKSKHFTILGLPIISFGKKEEWLECMGCGENFGRLECLRRGSAPYPCYYGIGRWRREPRPHQ